MMLIECPHCGARNVTEFTYGGAAGIARPAVPSATSDAEWTDYVYMRDNPRGRHDEIWQHSAGCRRWIAVRRDTLTHDVIATADPGELPPR
ncbi:MAG: sarcosine oxidase subunit delta [Burkholderiales bacterium]